MAVKKSALYSRLWDSCNTLRSKGGMDATQYKDYVLIILFMKVITDKYYGKKNSIIEVPDDANFNTMISLKGKTNIGEKFNEIIKKIAEENELQTIIDVVDFNDETKLGKGKDKIDALTGLVNIFQDPELDFSNNRADDDDILGDAYEFLMKKFASEAGKSKGQFYTPSEVSRVMAKIIGINKTEKRQIYVYDMACGSGSLLLKAGAEAPEGVKVNLYGQEKDNSTAGLSIMNMFLHGNPTAVIKSDNTLTKPQFIENKKLKTFDYCVANPPFSVKKWSSGMEEQYNRFSFGMPPENCADYAFLLHMLTSMDPDEGRGAIILPHGVLFRTGQEALIREKLVKNGYIEGIIGLPANLFYGTGIPACLLILDKKNASKREKVFIINAKNGYIKDGNKNRLREEDIKKIVDTYLSMKDICFYSRNVSLEEIKENNYDLNIVKYIEEPQNDHLEDINGHLHGGIPKENIDCFDKYWNIASELKNKLFKESTNSGYYDLKIEPDNIKKEVKDSLELKEYYNSFISKVLDWQKITCDELMSIQSDTSVKMLIESISQKMLDLFIDDKLIDPYDAYQYLMEYYDEIMKDDFHYIVENGWIPQITFAKDKKGNIKKNDFESDLLPKSIVINKYFHDEEESLDIDKGKLLELQNNFDEIVDMNTGEDYIFADDEKVNEKRIKELLIDNSEENVLIDLLNNLKKQKEIKTNIKRKTEDINKKIIAKYDSLDIDTSKKLVVNEKWFNDINKKYNGIFSDILNELADNLKNEYNNYSQTLNEITSEVSKYEEIVLEELRELGYKC